MFAQQLRSYPGWGNARDLIAMWKVILEQRASRVVDAPEKRKTITSDDCHKAVSKMVSERKPKMDPKEMKKNREKEEMRTMADLMKQISNFEIYSLVYLFYLGAFTNMTVTSSISL